MNPLLPWGASVAWFVTGLGLSVVGVSLYDARLWRSRWTWASFAASSALIGVGLGLWRFGSLNAAGWGVRLAWTLLPIQLLFGLGMLVAAPLHRLLGWLRRARSVDEGSARAGARRKFLGDVAALIPAGAVAVGTAGMVGERTRVVNVRISVRDLPSALEGFRILHLSDLHLGLGRRVEDLQELLETLRHDPPDLIAFTGDVADKLEQLKAGLEVATDFAPRYGVYAALGNHEYLSDIARTLPIYQASSVRLLRDDTATLRVGEAKLFVAGVDDPIGVGGDEHGFYDARVGACAAAAPVGAFRLLLCHRPSGYPAAARNGFHLTLSGHTHGGQVGLLGRSLFEVLLGVPFMWGAYRRGESHLYTTSGFGHWFPYRLNCPAEAPIIELRRA